VARGLAASDGQGDRRERGKGQTRHPTKDTAPSAFAGPRFPRMLGV
jgi:hypothetical protein